MVKVNAEKKKRISYKININLNFKISYNRYLYNNK